MKAFVESRDNQVFVTRGYGYAFPLHLHAHLELFLVHAGSISVTVGEHIKKLGEGSMAVVFPNQIHSYDDPSEDNRNTTAVIDLSYVGGSLSTLLRYHPLHPFIAKDDVHENIVYALDQMNQEYRSARRREIFAPLIQLTIARLFEVLELRENKDIAHQEQTWQIANYVNKHFQEPISLEEMAQHLGMCKFRLSRLFSTLFGQSFTAYVNSTRLSHACSLLEGTNMSITDISEESGFGSLRTFFRVFQKEQGMSPQAFRVNQKAGASTRTQRAPVSFDRR